MGVPPPDDTAPLLIEAFSILCQVKEAPKEVVEGVYVKAEPLHIPEGVKVLLNEGVGFTITRIVSVFEQIPLTVYVVDTVGLATTVAPVVELNP